MTRDEIGALLPFYVNGTLDGAERAAVAAALETDPGLRAEAEALAAIRATMQAEPVQSPGAFGLARLMREIDREAAPPPVVRAGVSGLWRIAAVLALALAVGQVAWIGLREGPPAVTLAGDGGGGLLVAFAPGTTEAALRALLLDLDLTIVEGPTALGLYRLNPADPDADTAALRASLLASGLVETADVAAE